MGDGAMKSILFVCTGNIFRSLIAEYALKQFLGVSGMYAVGSAGIEAKPQSIHPLVRARLLERGVDPAGLCNGSCRPRYSNGPTVSSRWGAIIKPPFSDCSGCPFHCSINSALSATSRFLMCTRRCLIGNGMRSWPVRMCYRSSITYAMRFRTSQPDCLIFDNFPPADHAP